MKKKLQLFIGLFLIALTGSAQISTLPYSESFDAEFTTGNDVQFITNFTGNEVTATNRIFRETTVFNSAPAALGIIPTGSFNGQVVVDLNLANYSDASLSFVAKSMANGDGSRPTKLEVFTSSDNGVTWSEATLIGEFPNADQETFQSFSYPLAANANGSATVKVRFSVTTGTGGAGTRAKLIIDDVVFDGEEGTSTDPLLTLGATVLNFNQTLGLASPAQSVSVFGINLTENVVVNVASPFEVALTEDGTYSNSQLLPLDGNGISSTVFVRLNSMNTGDFTGSLTAETAGVSPNPSVSLSGSANNSLATNPTPFVLSSGDYTFTEWSAESSAGTYPANMIFWTHATTDPDFSTAFEENYTCLYSLESRSRIDGEGENGFSFVNTGNSQYVGVCDGSEPTQSSGETSVNGRSGAAVLALNTINRQAITVEWTGRTIAPNNRVYALRLQYRISEGGGNPNVGWMDFENVNEYVANSVAEHSQVVTAVLPEGANNQEIVQLRWVYAQHESNTATGSRAQLALDDITVTTEELMNVDDFNLNNSFRMYPNPATDVVSFNQEVSVSVFDVTGKKVLDSENTTSINISNLIQGIYVLKTTEGVTKKLIVK